MSAPPFPRGLVQPEGAYRFGLEALLLAAFGARTLAGRRAGSRGAPRHETAVAELGAGCGAALLGVALRVPHAACLGLEREPALVEAARANVAALGLDGRVRFRVADVAEKTALTHLARAEGPRDMVLANPPWGLPGRGRPSPSPLRENALRGGGRPTHATTREEPAAGDAFPEFCAAAAVLLRHKGAFCCIVPALALTRICAALDRARLGLRGILPVRPRAHLPAHRLLVLARKGACAEPQLFSPLTLHGGAAKGTTGRGPNWTAAARAFCPWLAATPPPQPKTCADAPPSPPGGLP